MQALTNLQIAASSAGQNAQQWTATSQVVATAQKRLSELSSIAQLQRQEQQRQEHQPQPQPQLTPAVTTHSVATPRQVNSTSPQPQTKDKFIAVGSKSPPVSPAPVAPAKNSLQDLRDQELAIKVEKLLGDLTKDAEASADAGSKAQHDAEALQVLRCPTFMLVFGTEFEYSTFV